MFEYDVEAKRIKMYGLIGDDISADDLAKALEAMSGEDVTIRLQSEGGSVIEGMTMANAIADYPGQVRVEIDAFAASIATVFPMAADVVAAYDNSTLMIHKAWTIAAGNSDSFRELSEILEAMDSTIAGMYASKAGTDADQFLELMRAETWLSAARAQSLGLVDELLESGGKSAKKPRAQATLGGQKSEVVEFCRAELKLPENRPRLARVRCMLHSMDCKLH